MSANSQPLAGQSRSTAPVEIMVLIVATIVLAAIGVAIGQTLYAAPAARTVPADVQTALIAQRLGEKAPLFPARDGRLLVNQSELADRVTYVAPNGRMIQHQGELKDRFGVGFPTSHAGPKTGLQKGLGAAAGATTSKVIDPHSRGYWPEGSVKGVRTDMSSAAYAALHAAGATAAPASGPAYPTGGRGIIYR